jgi:hypothetical protein
MNKAKQKEILVLILCVLIGFALRFYAFDHKSLWIDEVHTFNESRYDIKEQFAHYKENPSYLQPPLFYSLTHLFYPFAHPERDLRIIPLIFGTLSIPMIYLLAAQFSPSVALPCTLSLTFMVYHISLSQDGRSYSLLLFLGMSGLYFLMNHLKTSKKGYLIVVALSFALCFYTHYSFITFIALLQIFWFYRVDSDTKVRSAASFLFLNGLILLFCLPWGLFSALSYKGQPIVNPLRGDGTLGSFPEIIYNVVQDWAPHIPATVLSIILLILLPFFSRPKKNAFILLGVLIFPIGGTYIFCKLFNVTHFVTARYFVNLLPVFFITLFLSIDAIEMKFEKLGRSRLKFLFVILLVASNLFILPLYYRSEKQDLRGLVTYLKGQVQDGDKIIVGSRAFIPGVLHYFGTQPIGRHYSFPVWKVSGKEIEYRVGLIYQDLKLTIIYSNSYWFRYFSDGSRLWIVADKKYAKKFTKEFHCVFKGYFDGSFFHLDKFPTDVSMYLLLWDPKSPDEKGIEIPIE